MLPKQLLLVFVVSLLLILKSDSKRLGGGFGRGSSGSRVGTANRIGGGTKLSGGYPSGSRPRVISPGVYHQSGDRARGGSSWGTYRSGGGRTSFGRSKPRFSASSFKSAALGAATGILAYEAGKHLIRSIASPFMYHGRSYYWGSPYYHGSSGSKMCRRPIGPGDPNFGDIYLKDGVTRPKEIVWSCNWNEYCCGLDCCYGGGSTSYQGFGLGTLFVLMIMIGCSCYLCFYGARRITERVRHRNAGSERPLDTSQYIPPYFSPKPNPGY